MAAATIKNGLVPIVGIGGCTSVGLTMPATAAAVRAGIASFGDHPFMVDTVGEPMVVARAPHLSEDVVGLDRFLGLALPAAQEALAILLPLARQLQAFPVVLGVPPRRPGLPDVLEKELPDRLLKQLAVSFPISSVEAIACGHAAGLMALESGGKKIQHGAEFCLVGGVDSTWSRKPWVVGSM
jgi:3-oxoacyl-[acyl-carrier-protein] synthase-1